MPLCGFGDFKLDDPARSRGFMPNRSRCFASADYPCGRLLRGACVARARRRRGARCARFRVRGAAHRDRHQYRDADLAGPAVAAARDRFRPHVSATRRRDRRGHRRRDAGAGRTGNGRAGAAAGREQDRHRRAATSRRRAVLQSGGSAVRADGRGGPHDAADDRSAAAARHAGGRSIRARRDGRAGAGAGGRAPRADQAHRPGASARGIRGGDRDDQRRRRCRAFRGAR